MNKEDLIKVKLNSIYGIQSCSKMQEEIQLTKEELIATILDKSAKEIIRNEIKTVEILRDSRSKLNFK